MLLDKLKLNMTQNENETLLALQHLMDEFFDHGTTNARKSDIEAQLNNFSAQRDSWKLCVYFITHTSNQYVSMYSLTTIESVITKQWNCIEWEHRVQLKGAIYKFYVEQDSTAPYFIRNKLAKLLVDIARLDWPHFYPDFFTNITQLLQSESGKLLGLILLRTTSEELISLRPDLTSQRKDELTRLLHQHIPQVFQLLSSIFQTLRKKHSVTATPPSSPTHPSLSPDLVQQISAASFRPDNKAITKEALATLQHLFTWTDLENVPIFIITTIFNFINFSSNAQDDDDMCVLAMSTLNEILYRKCVPTNSNELFIHLYYYTVELLKDIVSPSFGKIDSLGPDFFEKLVELLSLLLEQHLWRLERDPSFSPLEILGLLYQFTMGLNSAQYYKRSLSIWVAFMKQIKPQNIHKYSEALLGLVVAVLTKMQFASNENQLEEIDDRDINSDNETEWQSFQNTSIEIIAKVAEYAPLETFSRVLVPWKSTVEVYCMLENILDLSSGTINLEYSENKRLHCILRDLASLTQMLARLSHFFMDKDSKDYKQVMPIIEGLLTKLMQSASLATNARFYHLKMNDSKLIDDFIDVHSQILAALKTWCLWLNLTPDLKMKDVSSLIDTVLPMLQSADHNPPKVTHAAAHLLLSITNNIYPTSLIMLPSIIEFLQKINNINFIDRQSRQVVMCALGSMLIKPWGELSQNDTVKRQQMIEAFFSLLTSPFLTVNINSNENRMKDIIDNTLPCLSEIIDVAKNYPLNSKKIIYSSIKSSIDHGLIILPDFITHPEISEQLLNFFLNVLGVLQQQMGVPAIKHSVDVFLSVAIREQQRDQFYGLDKLLKILQLIIEAPSSSNKTFLPAILDLSLKNICPTLISQANEQPDTIIALLNLHHSILLYRWNYFYVSQIRLGNSPGCSDVEPSPDKQQPGQLLSLLQVFGQALLQPDINTFRTSLEALENLNSKWKLYHKTLFKCNLLGGFLTVLIQSLIDKSHNLLNDEIFLAIYNLAAVNFDAFFSTFLQQFLESMEGLTQQQKEALQQNFTKEIDTPTFVHHMQIFVNDLRCYRLCNASLPAGSVVLQN